MAEEKRKIYLVEVLMGSNLPEIDSDGILMSNDGIAYVKMHPVGLHNGLTLAKSIADKLAVVEE